ncbi:hypothetical protein K435DRAFT_649450, partial [Dendrothele bispora CBS 962.96]
MCPKCDSPIFHPRVLVDPDDLKIFQRLRDPAQATEEETFRVNQIIHDAERDFASYDAAIAQLEAAISVLKHKRQCLQDYVAKRRSLLSPIRRLPPEILSLIFIIHCRQSSNKLSFGILGIHDSSSISLSRVSIGWRRVALELPRLWSYLTLHIDHPRRRSQRYTAGFQYLLSFYLKRSLQVPLTVRL